MRIKKTEGLRPIAPLVLLIAIAVCGCSSSQAKEAKFLESGKKYLEMKDYARAILQFKNAARVKPTNAETFYQLGLAYLGRGDARAATVYLKKATQLDPQHVGAQLKLAELMALNRSLDVVQEAEKRAQAAVNVSPDNADALAMLALTEMRLGKADDAEQHLLTALQKFPQHLRSSTTLATLKLGRKDLKGAEEVLKEAVEKAPRSPEPSVALGRFYLMTGKPAEAVSQFRQALKIDPNNAPALIDLGATLVRTGQRDEAEQTYKKVSALPKKEYKPLHAEFLLQQGQVDAGIAELEKLVNVDPNDRGVRTRLVKAYSEAKRIQDAERVLSAALKQNPKDVEALMQRSAIHLDARRYAEAQKDLSEVLRYKPDSSEAHYLLAKVHEARGAPLNQRQELTEAVRLNPNLLPARLELARSLIAAKSEKAALDLMNQTPAPQKQMVPAIVQRNWVLLALGDLAELRKGIDQGLALSKTPDLVLQDGVLKLQQRDYTGARSALEEVLKQNPEDLRALDTLVRTYVAQKQSSLALERVRGYVSLRPQSAPLQYFLGALLLSRGNREEARAAFAAATAANPRFAPAGLALAQWDISEGKLDAARQTLSGLLSSNSGNVAARLQLGMLEETTGNAAAAIEHYRKVIDVEPTNVVALNNLAYRLATDTNRVDEALKFAQQAKELAPDHPGVDDTIGWIFYLKGIYRTAVSHLESAASKGGGSPTIQYHLAMAYLKAGDRQRGQRALETALQIDPNRPEAKMAKEVLAQTSKETK